MYQKPAQHERSVCIYVVLAVPGGEDILADYYFEPCSRDEKKSWIFEISTKLVCTVWGNAKCKIFHKSIGKINSSFHDILHLALPTRYILSERLEKSLVHMFENFK